ncbi:MAG: hypothetical protein GY929_03080 [Actinomycetia bacterium]|nr:hypothetical protein [Actinomycetes bacterium]
MKIAIVVLACASPPYDRTIDAMRNTWGGIKVPGVEVSYVYGNPRSDEAKSTLARVLDVDTPPRVDQDKVLRTDDVLIAGCEDAIKDQEDCLLRKRLIAFEHLLEDEDVKFIYTICAVSYVDQVQLVETTTGLRSKTLFYGPVGLSGTAKTPFVSGSSMLLSRDLAERLVADRAKIIEENEFGWRDDLTFGHWVATRYSHLSLGELIDSLRPSSILAPELLFVIANHQTADFVMAPQEEHQLRSSVYHYHFHSERPEDLYHFHTLWMAQAASRE